MILEIKLTLENPEISGKEWFENWEAYKELDSSKSSLLLTVKTDDGIFNFRGFDECIACDDAYSDFLDKFRTIYQTEFLSLEAREKEALSALSLLEGILEQYDFLCDCDVHTDKLKQIEKCIHDCCFDEEDGTFFDDESKELWESVKARLNKVWQRLEELSQKSIEEETPAE